MKWTKTKPQKEGFYWIRNIKSKVEQHVVQVKEDPMYGLCVWFKPEKKWQWFMPVEDMPKASEWAGPVESPGEPSETHETPTVGSEWVHKVSGAVYRVSSVSNLTATEDRQAEFPGTVEYEDVDGIKWSTSIREFLNRVSKVEES